jgi:hypothetical protein
MLYKQTKIIFLHTSSNPPGSFFMPFQDAHFHASLGGKTVAPGADLYLQLCAGFIYPADAGTGRCLNMQSLWQPHNR